MNKFYDSETMSSKNGLKLPEAEQHKTMVLPQRGRGGGSIAVRFRCFPCSVTSALTITCHMVQNVAMEVWIFMPVGGRSSPGRDISLVKKKEKIYKKVKKAPISTVREGVT